ncbi:Hyalin [Holothuria leucospilota]|uniref:Hyalin n=1 Tax=Holothuria leucospilota TaxID=206669 RepID=A0A9Q1CAZ5_HOLLE|nr:Hyalin [Holothuria leucospilota]
MESNRTFFFLVFALFGALVKSQVTFSNCPENDIIAYVADGVTSTPVTWTVPTAVDTNGNSVTLVSNLNPNDIFQTGTSTQVTYTYTSPVDQSTSTCMFLVNVVVDDSPPTITSCPLTDPRVFVNALDGEVIATWTVPEATDNSGTVTSTSNQEDGATYPIGFYDVIYTFTDGVGNIATCEFTFIVAWQLDAELPQISNCPPDVTVVLPVAGVSSLAVTWTEPTATDDAGPVRFTSTHRPGDQFTTGTTNVVYTFEDTFTRTSVCDFTVTVTESVVADTTSPVIENCPSNIVVTSTRSAPGFEVVEWDTLVVTDNSGSVEQTQGPSQPGGFFAIGTTTTVTYEFQDPTGNIAVCSFTVTVNDPGTTTTVTISNCPTDMTVFAGAGGTADVTWTIPTGVGSQGNTITPTSNFSPGTFPVGVFDIVYEFPDGTNNPPTCSFTLTVLASGVDNTAPVIENCPNDIVMGNGISTTFVQVMWDPLVVTDDSGVDPVLISGPVNNFGFFEVGTTTQVLYIYRDAAGNEATCGFTVTITSGTGDANPQISCPSVISGTAVAGQSGAFLTYNDQVTCTDDVGVSSIVCTPSSGSFFLIGTTSVSCVCTDTGGNTDTCVITAVVSSGGDTTPPTIQNCPTGGVSAIADVNLPGGFATWDTVIATDDSGVAPTVDPSHNSGDFFTIGNTEVTITFTDGSSNVAVCMFTVTILDLTNPVIMDCPSGIMAVLPQNAQTVAVTWSPEPTATDNSGTVSLASQSHPSGFEFSVGMTTVTYVFVDPSNNEAVCSFIVAVSSAAMNNPPTVLNCPSDITVTAAAGQTSAVVTWPNIIATDDSGITPTLLINTANSGDSFNVGTTTTVFYVFQDNENLQAICSFQVTVLGFGDSEEPTILNCPSNIQANLPPDSNVVSVQWDEVVAIDNSNEPPTSSGNFQSGDDFGLGTTSVIIQFSDASNNVAICTFDVIVNDVTNPVISNCPSSPVVGTVPLGAGGVAVIWDVPTATDNSQLPVTLIAQSGGVPGMTFPPGEVTVSYTFSDTSGNEAVCSFLVVTSVAGDGEAPVIQNCPPDQTVASDSDRNGAIVQWPTVFATDNSGEVPSITSSIESGTLFTIGSTPVVITATDASQNSDFCIFTITVTDETIPVITGCPGPVLAQVPIGQTTVEVTWVAPSATDNSGEAVSVALTGGVSGDEFPVGTFTITYTFTDASQNEAVCSFPVIVTAENRPPIITCPPSDVVVSFPNNVGNFGVWDDPTCVDVEDGGIVLNAAACSPQSNSFFNQLGPNTVTCFCTDSGGLTSQCSFVINVQGFNTPPVITCPDPVVVTSLANNVGNLASWNPPTCVDAEDGTITTSVCVPASGSFFQGVGVNTVTCTCTDSGGLTDECTFPVTVAGFNSPPVITCPAPVVVTSLANNVGNSATWNSPTCVDAEDGTITTSVCVPASGSFFQGVGVNTVTCTCTDSGGLSDQCTFSVTVAGFNSPPVVTCPAPVVVTSLANNVGNVASWAAPTCVDAEDGTITTSVCVPPSGSFFQGVGVNTVTCTCTDNGGLSDECTFSVTVQGFNSPPVITCPAPVVVTSLANNVGNTATWDPPTCVDAEDGTITTSVCVPASGSFFSVVGLNTVTCTCTDSGGLSAECTFPVTVAAFDDVPPEIQNCPGDITVNVPSDSNVAVVTWPEVIATDNSGITPVCTASIASGSEFGIGTTPVVITCVDGNNNPAFCNFNVIVNDQTPPVISGCPDPIAVTAPLGQISVVASWTEPTATDNSLQAVSFTVTGGTPGDSFPVGQSTIITYTFTDLSGNEAFCSFSIQVEAEMDTEPPVIVNCPGNIVVNSDPDRNGATVTWPQVVASDNSGIAPTITSSPESGATFVIGTTTVVITAVDNAQNPATPCIFSVMVIDVTPPVISNCPEPIFGEIPIGQTFVEITWVVPSAVDNSGQAVSISITGNDNDNFFSAGTNTVTYTFEDPFMNPAECTFPIILTNENVPPVITCPDPVAVTSLAGNVGNVASWNAPTCVDAEDGGITSAAQLVCVPVSGSFFPGTGVNTVTCTCTDSAGASDECAFSVTVTGFNTPPVITCPAPVVVTSLANNVGNTATWNPPTCVDAEDGTITTSVCVPASGSFFPGTGVNTVTCTCADSGGLSDECTFPVTVQAFNSPPVITCPATVVVTSLANNIGNTATWDPPTCVDAEDGTITTSVCVPASGSFFQGVGVNTVTCTCTDSGGLSDECTFPVTVQGFNNPPVITCPDPVVVTSLANNVGNSATWNPPTCVDAEDGTITTSVCVPASGTFFSVVGLNTVTCTCSDSGGLSDECTFPVTVQAFNSPPVITCPAPVVVTSLANNVGNSATWNPPTCVDAEDGTITTSVCVPVSGSFFTGVGVNTVTCTCTDSGGLSDECTFPVSITGFNTPPVITCPAPVVVTSLANNVGNSATWDPPTCVDAEDGTITTSVCVPVSGSFFTVVGVNTVTCTCTDSGGLSDECVFPVTVQGFNTPPVITCPDPVVVTSLANNVGNNAAWDPPTCVDAEDGTITTSVCAPSSGSFFTGVGVNTVTCTCTDSGGLFDECTFPVTVQGFNTPPVITCPNPVVVTALANNVGNFASWDPPTCVDAEDGTITTSVCVPASGSFFPGVGVNTVTCTCTDSGGLSDQCTFPVTVQGFNTPPVITCPDPVVVTSLANNVGNSATWNPPTCVDAEDGTITTSVCVPASGSFFSVVGLNTVTCTCTDSGGLSDECVFPVTVQAFNSPPVITCPAPVVVTSLANNVGNTATWNPPTCVDAEDGTITTSVCAPASGSFFTGVGVNTVTCTCTDSGGLSDECTFPVSITGFNTPPVITCPAPVVVTSLANNVGNSATWDPPTCVDAEDGTITTSVCVPSSGSFFPGVGLNTVTCTCTDSGGLSDECTFPVTVQAFNSPPVITCPDPVVVPSLANNVGNVASWDAPTCVDAEDGGITSAAQLVCVPVSGSFLPGTGVNTITCTCTDSAGASDQCTFPVTVAAFNTPPVITCPAPVVVTSLANNVGNSATWDPPTCVDAEDGTITTSVCVPSSGSFFPVIGLNTVTCTCTDSGGLSDECTFPVTVQGFNTPPVITCPDPVVVTSLATNVGNVATWDPPTCVDAEDGTITTSVCVPSSGSFFPGVGANTVTCTCTDSGGLSDECTFPVTIAGFNTPPVITCPAPVVVTSQANNIGNNATWDPPTCVDAEDGTITTAVCVPESGSFFTGVGANTVTCTCTDSGGLSDQCTFAVTIVGFNTPPVITCPDPVLVTSLINNVGNVASWDPPTCVDAEDGTITTSVCVPSSGSFFQGVGVNTVTCTCTDSGGLSDECTFPVTVAGFNTPPVITCPAPVVVTSLASNVGNTATWNPPTCVDAEDGTITTSVCVPPSGSFLPGVGVNTVTCTCTDSGGLSDECTFPVTVEAFNTPPVITCPAPVVVISLANNVGNSATWDPPTCVDAEDGTITTSVCVPASGSFFPGTGANTVTCTCTDSGGLSDECTFPVTVEPFIAPELVFCQTDITETVLRGTGGVIVTYADPVLATGTDTVNLISSPSLPSGAFFPVGTTPMQFLYSDGTNTIECAFTITVLEDAPCDASPCENGGICLDISLTEFVCVCSGCFVGDRCQTETDPCDGHLCANGGACISDPTSCTDYWCECSACFTGEFCQIRVDACRSNDCANGAICVPDPDECDLYTCQCTGCFTGDLCQVPFDPCDATPCQNGAICSNSDDSCQAYSCQCVGCFTGFNCEQAIPDPCSGANPCQNDGVCVPVVGSCNAHVCVCPPGFGGTFCESVIMSQDNPCNNFPCQNFGTCASFGSEYKCYCRPGFSGINCQISTAVDPTTDSCAAGPCGNEAVCYNSYVTTSPSVAYVPQYTCVCTNGFTGQNCFLPLAANPGMDACTTTAQGLCQNGGTCRNSFCSFDQSLNYFCECPIGWRGQHCDIVYFDKCDPNPCLNNAACTPFNTYFVCTCAGGFTGLTCEIPPEDDTSPIVVNCPTEPIVVTAEVGEDSAIVTWVVPTATDDSGFPVVVLSVNSAPGARYAVGTSQDVTYIFSDANGNIETCSFSIQVLPAAPVDNEPPVIENCPGDITVQVPQGDPIGIVNWTPPTATDNSGTVIPTQNLEPPQVLTVGQSEVVVYRFTDPSGNFDECVFAITVVEIPVDAPPMVTCPPDQTLSAGEFTNQAVATWSEPVATDDSNLPVTVTCTPPSGSTFDVGTNPVTCIAVDNNGNTDICTFTVTVQDDTPPAISQCPGNIMQTVSALVTSIPIQWTEPTATDVSSPVTVLAEVNPPLVVAVPSVTEIRYTFTDAAGNSADCVFTISSFVDMLAPVLVCPPNQQAYVMTGDATVSVSWDPPQVSDNVDNVVAIPTSIPGTFFSVGSNTVTYAAIDTSGNVDMCSFEVVVSVDNTLPVLTNCPADQTLSAQGGTSVAATWTEPTVSDAVSQVTLTATAQSGDTFDVGDNVVTFTAVDEAGNTAQCSFTITVTNSAITSPCAATQCPAGEICVEFQGQALCVPSGTGRRKRDLLSIEIEEDSLTNSDWKVPQLLAGLFVAVAMTMVAAIVIRMRRPKETRTDEVVQIQ